jgi:hypothetical protein
VDLCCAKAAARIFSRSDVVHQVLLVLTPKQGTRHDERLGCLARFFGKQSRRFEMVNKLDRQSNDV